MTATLNNSTYDKLKGLTQVGLPALGSLYFGLSTIWGLPAGEQVVGTIALLTTFCGVTLGISSKSYKNSDSDVDGKIVINRSEGKKIFALELEGDPNDLESQRRVVFKVVDPAAEAPVEGFWQANQNEMLDGLDAK